MNDRYEAHLGHPTESALADLVLGELPDEAADAVSGHVRSCVACRILADRLTQAMPDLPDGAGRPEPAVAVPDAVLAAVTAADRPEDGPRPGELWRASRPGCPVTIVWIRALDPTEAVVVVPVSFDIELADEQTLILPAEESPLGLPLALHVGLETAIHRETLLDRLGTIDLAHPPADSGTSVVSPLDERLEHRAALADMAALLAPQDEPAADGQASDAWWPPDVRSDGSGLLMVVHEALAPSHPAARITPAPWTAAAVEHVRAIAQVTELDAFVLVAFIDGGLAGPSLLEAAREVLHADQLLNAVCLVDPVEPFAAVVIDRRDVVAAIETPSGELRPPRQSRPPAPVGDSLTKFLDTAITPFGRLASTVVDAQAVDPRELAVDVAADAVRSVVASARGYKVEGKRPGYERVARHQGSITRLVEEALSRPDVDVASILEETE